LLFGSRCFVSMKAAGMVAHEPVVHGDVSSTTDYCRAKPFDDCCGRRVHLIRPFILLSHIHLYFRNFKNFDAIFRSLGGNVHAKWASAFEGKQHFINGDMRGVHIILCAILYKPVKYHSNCGEFVLQLSL
ncbi:hypothetical protein T11_9032, partial [Trichinella zimbabwensis]